MLQDLLLTCPDALLIGAECIDWGAAYCDSDNFSLTDYSGKIGQLPNELRRSVDRENACKYCIVGPSAKLKKGSIAAAIAHSRPYED